MSRTSYGAPGVYVEEIPSARQPIAGVGTNTVAFIGLVPKEIYVPVRYDGYDPVAARAALTMARAGGDDEAQAAAATELKRKLQAQQDTVTSLQAQLPEKNAAIAEKVAARDAAKAALDAVPEGAEADGARRTAKKDLNSASDSLVKAERAKAALEDEIRLAQARAEELKASLTAAPAPAPKAASGVEEEDLSFDSLPVPEHLLKPSMLRPYYLEKVSIAVEPLATKLCTNFSEYAARFGGFSAFDDTPQNPQADPARWRFKPLFPGHHFLTHAVRGFFDNGGTRAFVARVESIGQLKDVLDRIESIDEVSIIAAPGLPRTKEVWGALQGFAEDPDHQNVFAILDSQAVVTDGKSDEMDIRRLSFDSPDNLMPRASKYAAMYFPHVEVGDPAKRLQDEDLARKVPAKYRGLTYVGPSGHMAGVYARIDEERGVHKAPANAVLRGAQEVKYYISRPKQELLNPQGVNCLRIMDGAVVVWGARTIGGDRNGEWKYVNVRRFAGFLEESIDEGTQWVVFEPNDQALWSKIRLNITAFLTNVWRNGALVGNTPDEAFYVKCDAELNPPEVRDVGQVITEIGVAIVRPAEFVIFRIAQWAGGAKA